MAFSAGAPAIQPMPEPPPGPEPVAPPSSPPDSPGKKRGPWGLMLFAVGVLGGYAIFSQMATQTGGGGPAGPSLVPTAKVSNGALKRTIRLSGTVTAENFAAIRAPQIRTGRRGAGGQGGGGGSSGLTLIKLAEPGAKVEKGAVVAEFDRQSQEQAIEDQKTSVSQADQLLKVQTANSMVEAETKRQEYRAAKAEWEKAELDVRTAEVRSEIEAQILALTVEETQATYKELEQELKKLEIVHRARLRATEIDREQEEVDLKRVEMNAAHLVVSTPIPGVVVMQSMFRDGSFAQSAEGDQVRPGTYFMQIVDPTSMVLEAKVNQADSQLVRVGQLAEVRLDAYPDRMWPGRVISVSAMTGGGGGGRFRVGVGDFVRNITVKVRIDATDAAIIPDLSASADILVEQHENVLVTPREALHQEDGDWFVYFKPSDAADFIRKAVRLGPKNETHVAVTDGLAAGDEVALALPPDKE